MKNLSAIFIIFIIALRPVMPLADYALNYNHISKKLCENKEKPQLMCNGKCYLKKELYRASENTAKNDSHINISSFTDVFILSNNFSFSSIILISEKPNLISDFTLPYKFSLFSDIFHPPLV